MTGVATAIGASAVIGGAISAKSAGDALDAQESAAAMQYDISKQQLDLAKEQWNLYKTDIMPLEKEAQELGVDAQQLAMERGDLDMQAYKDYYLPMQEQFAGEAMEGVGAQPERAAREARVGVDQAFDTAEGEKRRDLERRGVRPGSGAYDNDISLNRAAAKAFGVNRAVEAERDRAEDVNFDRKAVALGRQPIAANPTQGPGSPGVSPALATAGYGAAGRTAYGAGSQYGRIAQMQGNAAAGAISGGVQLGMEAYDMYNKYATPTASPGGGGYAPLSTPASQWGGGGGGGGNYSAAMAPTNTNGMAAFNEGGPVDAPGGAPVLGRAAYGGGGEVNGPAGVDQVPAYIEGPDGSRAPARLTDEEYVIPADVVRQVGTDPLDKIIEQARMRKQKANSANALTRTGGR